MPIEAKWLTLHQDFRAFWRALGHPGESVERESQKLEFIKSLISFWEVGRERCACGMAGVFRKVVGQKGCLKGKKLRSATEHKREAFKSEEEQKAKTQW